MTDQEVLEAIQLNHLKANIGGFESEGATATIHWDRANVDPGGTPIWGPGPYLKVPITNYDPAFPGEEIRIRVHPPERLRKRLAKAWNRIPTEGTGG